MDETKSSDEPPPTLPLKRKPEFLVEDQEDHPNNKNPKLEKPVDHDSLEEKSLNPTLVSSGNNKLEPEEDDEEGEYEGEEEDEDDGDGDELNEDTEVDMKGKGIIKDDKGKTVAEEDNSDDDDSSDVGGEPGDSDLSDDLKERKSSLMKTRQHFKSSLIKICQQLNTKSCDSTT